MLHAEFHWSHLILLCTQRLVPRSELLRHLRKDKTSKADLGKCVPLLWLVGNFRLVQVIQYLIPEGESGGCSCIGNGGVLFTFATTHQDWSFNVSNFNSDCNLVIFLAGIQV